MLAMLHLVVHCRRVAPIVARNCNKGQCSDNPDAGFQKYDDAAVHLLWPALVVCDVLFLVSHRRAWTRQSDVRDALTQRTDADSL
jgi:hypothetical protein